ncbi:MAG: response regulator [Deltaproteobacteria bacterium]|nr:response regulator [Deltaproteobacteria bacterium]
MTETILVIDDDETIRRMVTTTLERAGFSVAGVSDGVAGVEFVRERRPDLIIVDLLLPRLLGFDVCRNVRALTNGKALPIIVTSTVSLAEEARREIREHFGIQHFLQKPFPFKDLLDAVGDLLPQSARATPTRNDANTELANNWTPEDCEVGLARFPPERGDDRSLAPTRDEFATLPELLIRLFRAEATGILALSDGKRKKEIAFDRGLPVRILTAFPGENIGQTLLDVGRVESPDFERAVDHATRWNLSLEQALVATKLVTNGELAVYQRLHAHQVILSAFTAYGCRWSFRRTEMSVPESLRVAIDPFVLVWEGISETLSLQELTNHFLPRRSECPRLTESYALFAARLSGVLPIMTPVESIDGTTPLAKLLARSNLGIASTLRVLYALELCGALHFKKEADPDAPIPAPSTWPAFDVDRVLDSAFGPSGAPVLPKDHGEGPASTDPPETRLGESRVSPGFVLDAEREYAVALEKVRSRSWGDAVASSRRAVLASPNDPRLHICLAETFLMSEGVDTRGPFDPSNAASDSRAILEAEAALVTALRLRPRSPRALCLLARVCLVRGRRDQALTLFGFARQIDPENDEVRAGLAAIRK